MGRILGLVCIVTMMSSAQAQRGFYYQREFQASYSTANPYDRPQSRNIQYTNPPNLENPSTRYPEARTNKIERIQDFPKIENGTYKILNRLQINKRGALEDSIGNDNDRVVFPGPTSHSNRIKLIIPDECKKKGYCENVPNYPVDLVENIVSKLGEKVRKFQMDKLDNSEILIATRLGGSGAEADIQLCATKTTILHPESAVDVNGDWYTVLNLKNKPLQGFLAELCDTTQSNSCNPLATFPQGYTSACMQKHVYRVMEALDSQGKQVQVPLKLPSCCSCVLNKTDKL